MEVTYEINYLEEENGKWNMDTIVCVIGLFCSIFIDNKILSIIVHSFLLSYHLFK
jgi:hypothetical protein